MSDEITAFVDALKLTGFFDNRAPVILARAPGRLDVMGGIADYSGSLVLQRPIAEATFAALQRTDARILNVVSLSPDPMEIPRVYAIPLASLDVEYADARALFRNAETRWAAYVIGVFLVMMRERQVTFSQGSRILISSRVPEGKGVASSAALEVAVMQAVVSAFDIRVDAHEMALLCQKAENLVAGAPCGVMDQMTAVCGESGSLLALLCQPAELQSPVRVPDTLEFWGIDSGERHAVSGSDYTSVRTGAFMGFRIIADASDEPGDYLADVSPVDFAREFVSLLPEEMSGAEFLNCYARIDDTVTAVDPARVYKIRQPAAHPIFENHRVHEFRRMLLDSNDDAEFLQLGELMYQSHASYSACGLGSPGTDSIVKLVRDAGPASGLFGARITGGGSGGTVAILGRADAGSAVAEIAAAYERLSAYRPYIFSGSSSGAAAFGVRTISI